MGTGLAEALGYLVAGGAAAYGVWRKFVRSEKEADSRTQLTTRTDEAQLTVIDMMQRELSRMSVVNSELANKVNTFQLENITLREEIANITRQMADLQDKNEELIQEVSELRKTLTTSR